MNDLLIYLKQRFYPGIFLMLAVFLLLYSKSNLAFDIEDIYRFFFLSFFLLIMRLYDDLKNVETDSGKANRIYTDKNVAAKLNLFLLVQIIVFLVTLCFFDAKTFKSLCFFLITNELLYRLLYDRWHFKNYLPLLKYPIIFVCLNGQTNVVAMALFLGAITFEILDDSTFPVNRRYAYVAAALSFFLLIPDIQIKYVALAIASLLLVTLLLLQNVKKASYLFLIVFLVTRLIFISHVL